MKKRTWEEALVLLNALQRKMTLAAVEEDRLPELMEQELEALSFCIAAQARGGAAPASMLCEATSAELFRLVSLHVNALAQLAKDDRP
jgi:hypothetical protein